MVFICATKYVPPGFAFSHLKMEDPFLAGVEWDGEDRDATPFILSAHFPKPRVGSASRGVPDSSSEGARPPPAPLASPSQLTH